MATERPTPTFIRMDPLDESALSAMAHKEPTQYQRITKMAIRQYLHECMSQSGQFHSFFEKFAASTADYHVNQELSDDLNERHIQIAAYYSNVRNRPPQIFIQDNGYNYVPDSLGGMSAGWNQQTKDGHQIIRIMDVVTIPIEITCAALSQQEVEDLASFLGLALGQHQHLTVKYILRPETVQSGVYWEVRLPFQHSISTKTHAPVMPGEPRIQLWSFTCSLDVEFENSTYMQYRSQPLYRSQRGTLVLDVPSTLPLPLEHRVHLRNHPDPVAVYSDDARIAVVVQNRQEWIIQPRRVGSFNLIVTRTAGPQQGPEILTQQAITVTAR